MPDTLLTIAGMGRRGEGIAHSQGRAVFVSGTLPGETVRVALGADRGRALEIVTPSPDRIAPFCQHYGTCGGCQLQHWSEDAYRAWKISLVEQSLHARGLDVSVRTLIDAHGAGRRRVSIHVRKAGGVVTAGYMAARTHALVDIGRCPILVPQLDRAFGIARGIGARLGECDVALTVTEAGIDASVKAGRKILEQEHGRLAALVAELKLARLSVNGAVAATALVPRVTMGKAEVAIPPGAFLQATSEGEAALARLVLNAIGKAKTVADLFCGCGPFALRLAEHCKVEAHDSDPGAIAALAAAAKLTPGLKPIKAGLRDLFREPLVPGEMKHFDAVVFDPPRAGAEAQARQLARANVKTIIAVSCDPASLARDAEILVAGGYVLNTVTAVDQFKWTSHVEAVAVFTKSQSLARST